MTMNVSYLSGQDVFHFTRSNTKGQSSKSTVGGSVRISTDGDTSRQSETLFRSNNVNNSLSFISERKVWQVKVLDIDFQLKHLCSTGGFFDKGFHIDQLGSVGRGHIMVDSDQSTIRSTNTAFGHTQTFKGLGRSDLVDQVPIDVNQTGKTVIFDQVVIPDFIVHGTTSIQNRRAGFRRRGSREGSKPLHRRHDGQDQTKSTAAKSHGEVNLNNRKSLPQCSKAQRTDELVYGSFTFEDTIA